MIVRELIARLRSLLIADYFVWFLFCNLFTILAVGNLALIKNISPLMLRLRFDTWIFFQAQLLDSFSQIRYDLLVSLLRAFYPSMLLQCSSLDLSHDCKILELLN